jgi:hypothetical protein
MKSHLLAIAPAPSINHRANRLLAALDPADFAALEPHLHWVSAELRNCPPDETKN